jgi:putative transposase
MVALCRYLSNELLSGGEEGMKWARFGEERIAAILKEAEVSGKITGRQHWIADATLFAWRRKCGGFEVPEMRRLRQLKEEKRRVKAIVAEQALVLWVLEDVLAKDG